MSQTTDTGFSWSRRRAAVAQEEAARKAAEEEAIIAQKQAELAEKTDEDILKELGLPDIESLGQGSDFKAFMSRTVPERLRKQALRKLWRSNPVLACVDGLNDYDDDYLTGSTGQGVLQTTYQVGKGLLAHIEELERLKTLPSPIEGDAPEIEEAETVAADVVADDEPVALSAPDPEAETTIEQSAPEMPSPRRMQFRIAGAAA